MKIKVKDPVIKKVVKKFVKRSEVGFKKYGVTLRDDSANMDEWLNHLQEELMDAVNYIERAREELKPMRTKTVRERAVEDYKRELEAINIQRALEDIDIVDSVTYSYTGPEKISALTKGKYDYGCSFCNCTTTVCEEAK
jgi:lipid II:glycine glycyltransferase (peptidoglycan interpeptide bridge formation enzyme)